MNRRKLAIIAGIAILAAALLILLWPDSETETHAEGEAHAGEEGGEAEQPEGLVLLSEEQIRTAEIELATVRTGAAVELVFPATVAASPTASARIDARASGAALARRWATMFDRAKPSRESKAPTLRRSHPS